MVSQILNTWEVLAYYSDEAVFVGIKTESWVGSFLLKSFY